jgi:ATP-dependent DNA helicase RecG
MQNKESQNIEYKESWRDEYLKWICGFANAQGGKIFIGINDDKQVVAVTNVERLMEDIPNKVVNFLGIVVDVNLHNEDGKDYIEIVVSPSNIPIALKGAYHYRSGSTKQELKGAALQQFILKKMGRSWDDVENERATIDDIDRSAVDYFLKKAIASNRMPLDSKEDSTEDILCNLNLMTDDGKIKNAALLLFAKRPSKFFTSSDFRIGRFIKDDSDLIFQDIVEGSIIQMADKVVEILRSKYLTSPISYKGLDRIETLEIPENALRELIFNSIIHKDYVGVHIQLKVFNDYMWLWNQGELPESLPIEELMLPHTSHPRNRNIANVFYKAGFIESWGRGIGKVTRGFQDAGLPIPKFESAFGGVLVTIPRPNKVSDTLNNGDDTANVGVNKGDVGVNVGVNKGGVGVKKQILELIKVSEGINAKTIATNFPDIVNRTVERYIKELRDNNIIEFRGAPKTGGYYIKK